MKKIILFALMMIFTLGATTVFAAKSNTGGKPDKSEIPAKTENKLSDEELSRLTKRVEEIRDMDKTNMSVKEKRGLKKEVKEIKGNLRNNEGVVYIGAGTLILIILLVIILV